MYFDHEFECSFTFFLNTYARNPALELLVLIVPRSVACAQLDSDSCASAYCNTVTRLVQHDLLTDDLLTRCIN